MPTLHLMYVPVLILKITIVASDLRGKRMVKIALKAHIQNHAQSSPNLGEQNWDAIKVEIAKIYTLEPVEKILKEECAICGGQDNAKCSI